MNDTDVRLWHPWLRINRVLCVMLHTRWSAEAWSEVRVEFRRVLALRGQIRRMTLLVELEEFVQDHQSHGGITGDATPPAWKGYLLTVTCPWRGVRAMGHA